MLVEISGQPASTLVDYASVPIAFEVRERLAVRARNNGIGGLELVPELVDPPYVKDYDAGSTNRPAAWAQRFDISRWGIFAAHAGAERVGGAVVVWNTPGVDMLEGRADLAVLWDLRVAPSHRGRGIGTELFRAAETWATARGAQWIKVETQNVNVPACRFYLGQGCVLGAIHRFAYPALPDEVQLLWYKRLAVAAISG